MTDGQIRYQTLMENRRHNLEMERLGGIESNIAARQASVREGELRAKQDELHLRAMRHQREMLGLNMQNQMLYDQMLTSRVRLPTEAILGTFVKGFSYGANLGNSFASTGYSQTSLFN